MGALDVSEKHGTSAFAYPADLRPIMPTATHPNIPAQLVADLVTQLARLRRARDDGDPKALPPHLCDGCYPCALERQLNRLIAKLPRQENP